MNQGYDPNLQYQQPTYQQPVLTQPNTLVFGILSLVFSGLLGMIFGIVGKKKGNEFIAQGGQLTGASKVGFILAKIGFILGLITLICGAIVSFIYIIMIVAGLGTGAFNDIAREISRGF